jgi:murein DD-endopeptidase MepM/ murein hydrolase activator NlpD
MPQQAPTIGWWKGQQQPYAYEQGWNTGSSMDYHPGGRGEMYAPDSSMSWLSTAGEIDAWISQEYPELNPEYVAGVGNAGNVGSPNTQKWANVNRWDSFITAAAARYSVPANLIKAVMQFESNGDPLAGSGQGATGLMQVMPNIWNGSDGWDVYDPAQNVMLGAYVLKQKFDQYGTWEMAARAYLGFGTDALGTNDTEYWNGIQTNWNELNAAGSGMFGGQPAPTGGASLDLGGIWGNVPTSISQEHGRTQFSATNPDGMYNYSVGVLGYIGHPGLDISMPENTPLYSPVSGVVERDGGSGSYFNTEAQRYQNGTGELRIRLDNGHEVIMGHMSRITVPYGTRVTAGMPVGFSGYPKGPHLHLEYRIPNDNMSSNWEAVDPRLYIAGGIIPGTQQTYTGIGSSYMPFSYKNLLIAGASGMPIPQGGTYASGGGTNAWNRMLRDLTFGGAIYQPATQPNIPTTPAGPYATGGPNR